MKEEQLVEIRRARLREAIDRWCDGNQAEFARKVRRAPSQISDMLSGSKSFGAKVARMLEEAMREAGMPAPAMFIDGMDLPSRSLVAQEPRPLAGNVVPIAQLDVQASMGNGATVPPHEDVVELMHVHVGALRAQLGNIPYSSPNALRLISAYGDSMAPTFASGDMLLVDTGVMDVRIDAVYVMSYRNELFIKRLQRRPNGVLRMLSDNKNYDPIDIEDGERDEFHVLGRVLMAWNVRKL